MCRIRHMGFITIYNRKITTGRLQQEEGACHSELLFTVTGTDVAAYLPVF